MSTGTLRSISSRAVEAAQGSMEVQTMTKCIDTGDHVRGVAALSRRAILGGAAAGFALAANGLFLPERLQETAAREGANNGELGGRHGKDHRGRDRDRQRHRRDRDRRRHRHDRDKEPDHDPPQGPIDNEGVLNIQFIFVNNNKRGSEPIGVTCYSYKWGTTEAISWEDKTVRPESGVAFKTTVKQASLYIDHDRHVVWATNPFWDYPTIDITSAGGRGGAGPKAMHVDDGLAWQYGNYKIAVTRNGDSDGYKVFSVTYES
jgi:hypothetical protein